MSGVSEGVRGHVSGVSESVLGHMSDMSDMSNQGSGCGARLNPTTVDRGLRETVT